VYLKVLRSVLFNNRRFFLGYLVLFIAGLGIQVSGNQNHISLFVNSYHNPLSDFVFMHLTHLGDFIFALVVVAAIFLFKRKETLNVLLCVSLPSLLTQLLKHFVFDDHFRPAAVLRGTAELYFVEGVDMHELNSFPSGHSTTVFAVFTVLALLLVRKQYQPFLLLATVMVAFSRIYLLQHFFQDVLVGSFIGVSCATLIYTWFRYRAITTTTQAHLPL
jgi:membrane-associated phospholipid phosphatase